MSLKRRVILATIVIVFFMLPFFWPNFPENRIERQWELVKWNSGTMQVVAYGHTNLKELERITNTAWQEIQRLDSVINEHDPNSEAGKLHLALMQGASNCIISSELWQLLAFSQTISQSTFGAFDITVGPLIHLWKCCGEENRLPTPEETQEMRKQVGWQKIQLTCPNQMSTVEPVNISLGAFSKGYAVDCSLQILRKQGITAAMVCMGGDLCCFGKRTWRIGIQDPRIESADAPEIILGIIEVCNVAIATSGHYRRYVEIQGKRYSHIMNPEKLEPVDMQIISVTTIAETCMIADAYATAFCVLPISVSLEVAQNNGIAFCIISKDLDGYHLHTTPGFEKYWVNKPVW